jgi:exopolysaccharide biosynthesis polyprenyl glycosylphosphotransferase
MKRVNRIVWFWSIADISIAAFAMLVCLYFGSSGHSNFSEFLSLRLSVRNVLLLIVFLMLWMSFHQLAGLDEKPRLGFQGLFLRLLAVESAGTAFFLVFCLFSHNHLAVTALAVIFLTTAFSLSICARLILWPTLPVLSEASTRAKRIIIVGSGSLAERLHSSLPRTYPGRYAVLGFIDSPGRHTVPASIEAALLGRLEQLEELLSSTAVDEVLIAMPVRSCYDKIQAALDVCHRVGVPAACHYSPFENASCSSGIEERAELPHLVYRPGGLAHASLFKRAFDIVVALLVLVLLAPVLIVIGIVIKLSSRGPVLFIQERYGLNKRRFRMYKFRTMVVDAEARQAALETLNEVQGPVFKIAHDPRVTDVGRILRKSSLDELPQLLNVLKGDMSLVGPRPLPVRDVARFEESWLMRRFSVKPGLTCLWQVQGRSNTSFTEWIALDLEYIDNWSPLLDLKILALTVPAVVRGSGAM